MSKNELVEKSFQIAKERYAAIGVDVDKALASLQKSQSPFIAGKQMTL